jgi:CRP-like cAMP-binding protein
LKLCSLLQAHFLFSKAPVAARRKVVDAMQRNLIAPDEMIITQGDKGDTFYVLEIGRASVIVDGAAVAEIEGPNAFGELALMYNSPRAATIKSTSFGVLWSLDRRSFRWTLADTSTSAQLEQCQFLKRVPLLGGLNDHEISRIAGALQKKSYAPGETICMEGDQGDDFYIIADGEVLIKKNTDAGPVTLNMLSKGQFFGERALLCGEPRNATVEAMSNVQCLALSRDSFDVVLGPLGDILSQASKVRDADTMEKIGPQAAPASGGGATAATTLSMERGRTPGGASASAAAAPVTLESSLDSSIVMSDLETLTTIGTGTFGRVYMVEHRPTMRMMALKVRNTLSTSSLNKLLLY